MTRLVAALVAGLLFAAPLQAQECASLSFVTQILDAQGSQYVVLSGDEAQKFIDDVGEPVVGAEIDGATSVIIAILDGYVVFGYEKDGCVTDPIVLPGLTTLPARNSGRLPDGSTHA